MQNIHFNYVFYIVYLLTVAIHATVAKFRPLARSLFIPTPPRH